MSNKCFQRLCGSILHDKDSESFNLINLNKGKKITRKDYDAMLHLNIVTKSTRYICTPCFEKAKQRIANTVIPVDDDDFELYKKVIEVGDALKSTIGDDIKLLKSNPIQTIQDIISHDYVKWLSDRPTILLHLLSAICEVDVNTANNNQIILISKIIELIYSCKNSKIVLPNHFMENLMCYCYTNCKTYLNFMGSRSPGGAYTHICNWLKEQSQDPLQFPKGLAKSIFDNSQKVGKTYIITGTNKVPTSVITSHLWVTLDEDDNLQDDISYSPTNWLLNKKLTEQQRDNLLQVLTKPSNEFRVTRDNFITKCIGIVNNQVKDDQDCVDEKLRRLADIENHKVCIWCNEITEEMSHRVCRNCGGKLVKEVDNSSAATDHKDVDPYSGFLNCLSSLPDIKCMAGEPDFVNPSGYHNVIQVLQSIGTRAGIKQYGNGSKEWLFVECDGLPYNLIRDIITNVLRCTECNRCFYGSNSFQDHKCFVIMQVSPTHEFGWLLPVFGLLHLEMNLGRAFIKLNWEIFVKSVGFALSFKSPKAQEYLKKGSDHHKMWHLLEILYSALTLEIIHPYVKHCKQQNETPTCEGYWIWCKNVQDPNYAYIQNATFSHLHALMMLRAGKM